MTDTGYDNRMHGKHGTGDCFLIEAPQILNRSTASCQQDDIMSALIRLAQIFNDGSTCLNPLYQARIHHNLSQRPAPGNRRQNILYGRSGFRGNHTDAHRILRQRLFLLRIKQALCSQLLFHFLQLQKQITQAIRTYRCHIQLYTSARLIHGDRGRYNDLHPLLQQDVTASGMGGKHNTADFGTGIL